MSPSGCAAPSSALYLDPEGRVTACCASRHIFGYLLGPGRPSLMELWRSAQAEVQRAALADGRYDAGCDECGNAIAVAGRRAALAYHFDRFSTDGVHEHPVMLDLALSNRCNLQCVMCHGGLSSSIRAQREGRPPLRTVYDERFFAELEEMLPHVRVFNFKGGEPFLAREARRVWDRLVALGTEPHVTVTTNGTVLNRKVEHYLRALRMHAIVSVDGMDDTVLESIRVGVDARRFWSNVDRIQAITEETGAGMSLSFCLMEQNWEQLPAFLVEADRRGVNPNVVIVADPSRFDLLRRSPDGLRDVLGALEAMAPPLVGEEHRRAWETTLGLIGAAVGREVAVPVPSARRPQDDQPPAVPSLGGDDEATLLALLLGGPGAAVVVDLEGSVVAAVTGPERIPWLEADRLVGRRAGEIVPTIADRVGPVTHRDAGTDAVGADLLVIEVDRPDGRSRLAVHSFRSSATGRVRSIVVDEGPVT